MSLLRKQLQGNNFGKTAHTQYGAAVPCAESEFEAISDIADASVLANEMQEDTRELNLITNTAQKAEDAGTIFDLAAILSLQVVMFLKPLLLKQTAKQLMLH